MPRNRGVTAIGGVAAVLLVIAAAVILFRPTSAQTFRGSPRMATNEFPNVPLVTQGGKPVMFYDDLIKDKKVVINFMYTDCPDACPLDTAKLVRVQKALGERVGRDLFMYSITLDPEHDTPAVLKQYAESYGAGPGWLFLTGERTFIDMVRFKLGERRDKGAHSNTLRIGNGARGEWMTLSMDGDVARLVTEIGKTLDPEWYAGRAAPSFAEAPRLRAPEPGEATVHEQVRQLPYPWQRRGPGARPVGGDGPQGSRMAIPFHRCPGADTGQWRSRCPGAPLKVPRRVDA